MIIFLRDTNSQNSAIKKNPEENYLMIMASTIKGNFQPLLQMLQSFFLKHYHRVKNKN